MEAAAERERVILDELSRERLMEYTRGIARWVRLSGTDDERRAVDYVRDLLDGFGLETRVIEHPAYISLPGQASLQVLEPERLAVECITHSMAASTPPGGVDRLPKTPVVSVRGADGERLIALAARNLRVRLTTRVDTGWRSTPLLLADLPAGSGGAGAGAGSAAEPAAGSEPGSDARDFVLFSGHIDSWHYGAMDNATANAAMIEIARALAPHRDHLRRGLRLAFWSGHSHGRYSGSTWYADHAWEELYRHCVAHVNIDSVGGRGATVLTGAICMTEARGLARAVIEELTGQRFEGARAGRAGDQSFWGLGIPAMFMSLSEQPLGTGPTEKAFALLLGGGQARTGGLGWWWHTPEDTVDKIDPEFLLRDAKVYAAVIHRLLTDPVLPFDYAEHARELVAALEDWQRAAGNRFDLSEPLRRARELERRAQDLRRRAGEVRRRLAGAAAGEAEAAAPAGAAAEAAVLNGAIKRLGRLLIPLNYSEAGPFDHDPGVALPPIPVLRPIRDLAASEPGSHAARMLETRLVRARNYVNHTLAQALDCVDGVLGGEA